MTIRSKHNDLLNYFIHDERDLSPAYVASCRKFLNSLRNHGLVTKQQANKLFKRQASSSKRQAWQAPSCRILWDYENIYIDHCKRLQKQKTTRTF